MIRSINVLAYFENFKKWYAEQGIIFDNWNDTDLERRPDGLITGRDLFYVPKSTSEHLIEFLVRYALSNNKKEPGEPWIYLGFNVTALNALQGTRSHITHRTVPTGDVPLVRKPLGIPDGSRQTKWFRESVCDLSVFMVTNKGNKAEDLEEIYEARIQMKSEFPVNMGSVFIFDYPEWQINSQHKTLQTSNPIVPQGNLWGLKYDVTLTAPALEFGEKQMAAANKISVDFYEMSSNRLLTTILEEK